MQAAALVWLPAGKMARNKRYALSVQVDRKPSYGQWQSLMAQHIQAFVDLDPQQARDLFRMSEEHLPEIWSIPMNYDTNTWGEALASSDTLHALSGLIDWTRPGHVIHGRPPSIDFLLEQLP